MAIIVFLLFAYGISERLWFQIDYDILMLAFRQLFYHDIELTPVEYENNYSGPEEF